MVGQKADVLVDENRAEDMAELKQEAGREIREAEIQIMEEVEKTREPLSKTLRKVAPATTIHGFPRLSKDAVAFSRAFKSVTLSTLEAVDRIHEVERMKDNWDKKAARVAKMKTEREKRRRSIQEVRQRTRDSIEAWKIAEENKLARLRDETAKEAAQGIMDRTLQQSIASKTRQKEAIERSFATEFAQQTLSMGRGAAEEHKQASLEEKREEIKKQVRQATECARQRRQEICAEREIRQAQLVWEGALARKELSGKMVQAAVERMSEAKRRVGQAVNRRAAAKASVVRAKEALRESASRDLPPTQLPVKLDLRPESELAEAGQTTLEEVTADPTPAPFRLRSFTHEANRSWQRGTLMLTERERHTVAPHAHTQPAATTSTSVFPSIHQPSLTHYNHQLRPGRILCHIAPTPLHSELTDPTPSDTPSAELCTNCDQLTPPYFVGVA